MSDQHTGHITGTPTALYVAVKTAVSAASTCEAAVASSAIISYLEALDKHNCSLDVNVCVALCELRFHEEVFAFLSRITFLHRAGVVLWTPNNANYLLAKHSTIPLLEALRKRPETGSIDFNTHIAPQLINFFRVAVNLVKDARLCADAAATTEAVAAGLQQTYEELMLHSSEFSVSLSDVIVSLLEEMSQMSWVFEPQLGARFSKSALINAGRSLQESLRILASLCKLYSRAVGLFIQHSQRISVAIDALVSGWGTSWQCLQELPGCPMGPGGGDTDYTLHHSRHMGPLLSHNAALPMSIVCLYGITTQLNMSCRGAFHAPLTTCKAAACSIPLACPGMQSAVELLSSVMEAEAFWEVVDTLLLGRRKRLQEAVCAVRCVLNDHVDHPPTIASSVSALIHCLRDVYQYSTVQYSTCHGAANGAPFYEANGLLWLTRLAPGLATNYTTSSNTSGSTSSSTACRMEMQGGSGDGSGKERADQQGRTDQQAGGGAGDPAGEMDPFLSDAFAVAELVVAMVDKVSGMEPGLGESLDTCTDDLLWLLTDFHAGLSARAVPTLPSSGTGQVSTAVAQQALAVVTKAVASLVKRHEKLKAEDLMECGVLHALLKERAVVDAVPPLIALRAARLSSSGSYRFGQMMSAVITVDRSNLLNSSMSQLRRDVFQRDSVRLRDASVIFSGEGHRGPGVFREWLSLVSKSVFHPDCGLFKFCEVNGRAVYVSPHSAAITPAHYTFAGQILALALVKEVPLYFHLAHCTYKQLAGEQMDLSDLAEVDPVKANSYQAMLDSPGADALGLTFDVEYIDGAGQRREVELAPGGKQMEVTDGNKALYINYLLHWDLTHKTSAETNCLRQGFRSIFPASDPLYYLSHAALCSLIGGEERIDPDDWIPRIDFRGWSGGLGHPVVACFVACMRVMSQGQLSRLLHFWCGMSSLPLGGFGSLPSAFQCVRVLRNQLDCPPRLPQSHTCMFQMDLPEYRNQGELEWALGVALENCAGFGRKGG